MRKLGLGFLLMLAMLCVGGNVSAQMSGGSMSGGQMMGGNPMVGGAAMYKTKNIVENAVNSKDHTTLVAAVKAAGLVETLQGNGHSRFLRRPIQRLICFLPERLTLWLNRKTKQC